LAGAPGTFFVRGEQFKHAEGVLGLIVEAGREIQAHCYSHSQSHDRMSKERIEWDVLQLLRAIDESAVHRPTLWRPPAGIVTENTHIVAQGLSPPLTVTQWHVPSNDHIRRRNAGEMCDEIMAQLVRDGDWVRDHSVVLMHDHPGANAERQDALETVRVIPMLIDAIQQAGGRLAFHGSEPAWISGNA
jgi:peptidoglycan/xylan/chitin deacetylase (PgdA/CDA1 family)